MKFHVCSFLMVLIGFNSIVDNFLKVKIMILQAGNGCFLTQSEDVSINERRFEKKVLVSSIEEAEKWKEIPEYEKDKIVAGGELFQPETVDYEYLNKVESLISVIAEKINDGGLTAEQALEMQKYYPKWED